MHSASRRGHVSFAATCLVCLLSAVGCCGDRWASLNDPLPPRETVEGSPLNPYLQEPTLRASRTILDTRGNSDVTVFLAISGGGSRSAYFGACVMFGLGDLLSEVDVISAVSGGTLPASYYCITEDPAGTGGRYRPWAEKHVKDLMRQNLRRSLMWKWFSPVFAWRSAMTDWDRSDMMAELLARRLFYLHPGTARSGGAACESPSRQRNWPGYTLGELNPNRPYLIINAASGTSGASFGEIFTYTHDDFLQLGSNVRTYSLSRAVAASAAVPALFNHVTLRNYRAEAMLKQWGLDTEAPNRYLHVFDGGVCDNLGLTSVMRAIRQMEARRSDRTHRYAVIIIDAQLLNAGVAPTQSDPRASLLGTFVDTNFIGGMRVLLKSNRTRTLQQLDAMMQEDAFKGRIEAVRITFDSIPPETIFVDADGRKIDPAAMAPPRGDGIRAYDLQKAMYDVPIDWAISDRHANLIEAAARELLRANEHRLRRIRQLVGGK